MIGLFGIFGRSKDLQRLDAALRARGLHPRLLPEAAKLTVFKLLREETRQSSPPPVVHERAAELLAYCRLGTQGYAEENGVPALDLVEQRLEAALEEGESLDARLILLMLQGNLIQPSLVERFELSAEEKVSAASS